MCKCTEFISILMCRIPANKVEDTLSLATVTISFHNAIYKSAKGMNGIKSRSSSALFAQKIKHNTFNDQEKHNTFMA